jgi:hypothetical protein
MTDISPASLAQAAYAAAQAKDALAQVQQLAPKRFNGRSQVSGLTGSGFVHVTADETNNGASTLYFWDGSALKRVSSTVVSGGNGVYVVAITGQSNAAGAHSGGPNPASSDVKVWDGATGAWGSSDYTQAPFSRAYPDGNNGNNNIGLAFAHRLAAETGGKVYLIYDAWGGRPISEWVGSGTASPRYAAIKAKIQAALASPELVAAGKTTIDHLIYAQGEANGTTDLLATYTASFTTLDTQFRAETWMTPTTPMLVMGMSGLHSRYQVWQAQLDYCENTNRACVYVNSMGLKTAYDVNATMIVNVDNTAGFVVNDTATITPSSGVLATATIVSVGTGTLGLTNVSGAFDSGTIVGALGGSANLTSVTSDSDYTHWLGDSLWEHGYHRAWYALKERAMSHRSGPAAFYGRGSGPWRGSTVAIAMFKSLVSYSSATATFPMNAGGASDCMSWGYQCVASNNSLSGGYQATQDTLARYGVLWGRSLSATSGADYHAAFGYQNTISATYGFAAGRGNTVADSGGAAFGTFAKYTTAQADAVMAQVGIGSTSANAKNALTVRKSGAVEINVGSTADPTQNQEAKLEFVSNTQLKIKMRGTDGVVRSVTLTLA